MRHSVIVCDECRPHTVTDRREMGVLLQRGEAHVGDARSAQLAGWSRTAFGAWLCPGHAPTTPNAEALRKRSQGR